MTHSPAYSQPSQQSGAGSIDDLARVFNTALIATQSEVDTDLSSEIYKLMETPGFRSILSAVRHLSRTTGAPERDAAETVIQTFRQLDKLWSRYLLQEGTDRLKNSLSEGR